MEELLSEGKDNDKKHVHKNRFMGKLFKEKKPASSQEDVNDFLHGPSDKLYMMPGSNESSQVPSLSRIDTGSAPRWPTAAEIKDLSQISQRRNTSAKRNRNGLVVRFTNDQPEVIGEGGDEATSPVSEIGARRRAHTHPPRNQQAQKQSATDVRESQPGYAPDYPSDQRTPEEFTPGPIQRTQTGLSQNADAPGNPTTNPNIDKTSEFDDDSGHTSVLRSGAHDPTSFAARMKAEMRSGEGNALLQAASNPSLLDQHFPEPESPPNDIEITPELDQLHVNTMTNTYVSASPGLPPEPETGRPITPQVAQDTMYLAESPVPVSGSGALSLQDAALAVGDSALQEFTRRSTHVYKLFQLSAESIKPLSQCSQEEAMRIALWWFLKGRSTLETSIRARPATPDEQQANATARHQAYTDLAKVLWILDNIKPQYSKLHQSGSDPALIGVSESRDGIMSSLRKLAMSMKRNNILPPDPEDAPLLQGVDNSIWVQDDGNKTLVKSQRFTSTFSLLEAFSLGDSSHRFHYGRMFVEAVLVEDSESQYYRCHVLLSIFRGQNEKGLTVIVASQDGCLSLGIQNDKSRGPSWEDVTWQPKKYSLEIKLPRGFVQRIHCSEQDFRTLWGIYDYHSRMQSVLDQRRDEELIFETTVKNFQQFELTSNAIVPKDPLSHCQLKVFEKRIVEKAATGARSMHRGFRLALRSNTKTRNVKGINQSLPPSLPIQFGFLRGNDGFPAYVLKTSDEKSKSNIVLTFDDNNQRTRLHSLLTGVALGQAEDVVAEAGIQSIGISTFSNGGFECLKTLDWQSSRVINEVTGDPHGIKTVLSEHLRIVLDSKSGTLTDRINVGPGELKIRLDVNQRNQLKIFRQSQLDMTLSISESQVSKKLPAGLIELLQTIAKTETSRTYSFPSVQELHLIQSALTGFQILFDGTAVSLNIARRRMVVPIYKKWDAATTRIQVVQREKVVQLLAFFENFSHGDCMNFTLKSTDVFEVSSRTNKYSIRIVDAKFALPKAKVENVTGIDQGFVCLDMPEYPGEHDDITIVFETEADCSQFAKSLPAPVKSTSRMGSIRK